MKKQILLFLILLTFAVQGQTTVPQNSKLAITKNVKQNSATRIIVQDSITKELNWILKSSLVTPIPTLQQVTTAGATTNVGVTFTGSVQIPNATLSTQATSKGQMDALVASTVSGIVSTLVLKEDLSNKSNSYSISSIETYPNTKALVDGLATKQPLGSYLTSPSTLQQTTTAGATTNVDVTFTGDVQIQAIPLTANSAVSKNYFDNALTGLSWKNAVKCSTTSNQSLSGTSNVDGVTAPIGTRVLVRFQTIASENGIYLTASGSWIRTTDADSASEINETTVLVTAGTL